ncbi:MAG: hypothetical protein RLZZ427_1407 [Pseudomonadota bacterium]|jgi:DNA-binding response OmpR family regulator
MVVVRHGASAVLVHGSSALDVPDQDTYEYLENRYISINDTFRAQRDAWLEEYFPGVVAFNFSDDDTKALSRYPNGYGVLVVGGNDVARMGRFLKANRAALSGVVKICLTCGSTAQKRAQALHAGFDDVFDIEKMQGVEAVARVQAMRRRYQSAIELDNSKIKTDRVVNEYAAVERLTDRERAIMEVLIADKHNFISYAKVQQICSDFHNQISFENVKVIICNLRKKLKDGVRIIAQPHKGYLLLR